MSAAPENIPATIAVDERIKIVRCLHPQVYHCQNRDGDLVLKIFPSNSDGAQKYQRASQALTSLSAYTFKNLVVPKLLRANERQGCRYILMTYEKGEAPAWSEKDNSPAWGGTGIPLEYVGRMCDVLHELNQVEIQLPQRRPDNWHIEVCSRLLKLHRRGGIATSTLERTTAHLRDYSIGYAAKRQMVSNGDFYPRNLIVREDGKSVLVDWDQAHTSTIEEEIMYAWVHFFGNRHAQDALLQRFGGEYPIDTNQLRIGLIISALHLVEIWLTTKNSRVALVTAKDYLAHFDSYV